MVYTHHQYREKMETITKSEPVSAHDSGSSTSISTSSSSENGVVISVGDITKENRRYDNDRQSDNRNYGYGGGDRESYPRRNFQHHDRGYAKKSFQRYGRPHNQGHGHHNNGFFGNNAYHGHNGYNGNNGYGNRGYRRGGYHNDYYAPTHHHTNYQHNYNGYAPHYTFPYYNTPSQTRASGSGQVKPSVVESLVTDPLNLTQTESPEPEVEEISSNPAENSVSTHHDEHDLTVEDLDKSINTSGTAESCEKYEIEPSSPNPLSDSDCSTVPPSSSPSRSSPEPEPEEIAKCASSQPTNPKIRSGSSRTHIGDSSMTNVIPTVGWGIESLEQNMYFNTTKGFYTYPPSSTSSHNQNYSTDSNRHGYRYSHYHANGHRSFYHNNHRENFNNYDLYNSHGSGFYPSYFHEPHHFGNTIYNPAAIPPTQFMFQPPEIGLNDVIKSATSLSLAASTDKWGYTLDDEKPFIGEIANCGSRSLSPSNSMINNTSTGQNYTAKKRNGSGALSYPIVPATGNRRGGYHRNGQAFETRWTHLHQFPIEEMVKKYKYVEKEDKPDMYVPDEVPYHKQLESLSNKIWTKFQQNQQTPEMFRKKLELWRELSDEFKQINPMYQLEIVGSTISGFGSNTSDIDICLLLNHRNETDPRGEAIDILENLSPRIELIPNLVKTDLILAKVPILKLKERTREIDIDINVNNSVGLRNTQLLFAYGQADWRVRPLVLVVKLWASYHGINDAKCMTLSSYSLSLMVIHYLQHGVSPAVLPNLQVLYADRFSQHTDISKIRRFMMDPVNGLAPSTNKLSLGELMIGFLEYYAVKFDYKANAISVRNGSTVPVKQCAYKQAPKNDAYQWKFFNIEGTKPELTTDHYHFKILEPFEFTNTARSVYDKEAFDRIRGVFITSWQRLAFTHDLESIFTTLSPLEARLIGSRARTHSSEGVRTTSSEVIPYPN